MDISLEAIDAIRARASVTYREAKEALEQTGGDLIEALARLEENRCDMMDQMQDRGRDIFLKAKHVAAKLHQTKMKIKIKDNTVAELPVTYSALGAALFPKLATIGVVGLLVSRGSIEVNNKPVPEAPVGENHYEQPEEDYHEHGHQ